MGNMTEKIKQNKMVTAVLLVTLIAVLIYFFRDKLFTEKSPEVDVTGGNTYTSNSNSSTNSTASSSTNKEYVVLQLGSSGAAVKELQQLLNAKHRMYDRDIGGGIIINDVSRLGLVEENGVFDSRTKQVLQQWTPLDSITLSQARKILN
jgi:hypothetical protein